MTRKHFQELADFAARAELNYDQIEDLMKSCKMFNKNFDRARFWDAVVELQEQYK